MNKFLFTLLISLIVSAHCIAQFASHVTTPDSSLLLTDLANNQAATLAKTISTEDLSAHLHVLASDEYEGRETGTKANDLAAGYIAQHFKTLGLPAVGQENTYYQGIAFNRTGWKDNEININGNSYKHLWDYLSFATVNDHMPSYRPEEIIFLGYGIDDPNYSDYKGNNVKGKVIMINKGEPLDLDSVSYISKTKAPSDWNDNVWKKLEETGGS